jgi:tRNA(Ile)-lysidine synthase
MLVRPLLGVSRDEVRAYLSEIGQPYREDASNADLSRTRARIRHDLLPKLAAEYNPKVVEALARLGELAAASERAFYQRVLEMERAATHSFGHLRVVLDRERLLMLPRFLRAEVLRSAWRRAGWPEAGMDARRWMRLAGLAKKRRGRVSIGAGVEVSGDSSLFILDRSSAPAETLSWPITGQEVPLQLPGATAWLGSQIVTTLDPDDPRDETVDLDRLVAPLWVRAPVPGDRFEPLGMEGRSTPLNDFFRGRHVPRDRRARTPLVCDGAGVVWVVGHRIAHRVRLTDATRRELGLRWLAEGSVEPGPTEG